MAKCAMCGKSTLFNGAIKLSDATICAVCFKALGFSPIDDMKMIRQYPLAEVQLGRNGFLEAQKSKMRQRAVNSVLVSMNYGPRDVNATDEEEKIFGYVQDIFKNKLDLVRLSDNYLTIQIEGYDLMRYKFTDRAKWLNFPPLEKSTQRHEIDQPDDVLDYVDIIKNAALELQRISND